MKQGMYESTEEYLVGKFVDIQSDNNGVKSGSSGYVSSFTDDAIILDGGERHEKKFITDIFVKCA